MNRVRIMKHDIPGLKPTNQPLPLPLRPLHMETARIIGQLPELPHIRIERADPLRFRQRIRPAREILLDRAAQACGIGEIDEPAAGGRDIADGDPGGEEVGGPVAEEELVVVDPRAQAVRDVVPEQGAPE